MRALRAVAYLTNALQVRTLVARHQSSRRPPPRLILEIDLWPKMTRKDVRFVTATVRDATQHCVVSYTLGPSTPQLRTVVPYTLGPSMPLLRTATPWLVPHETSQSPETEEVVLLQLLANRGRLEKLVTSVDRLSHREVLP